MRKLILIAIFFLSACSSTSSTDEEILEIPLSTSKTITDTNGDRYSVGFNQVTEEQQNPFVEKTDASGNLLWEMEHDNSPVDVRATIVTLDSQNRPWVVFTLNGGSSSTDYLNQRFTSETAFQNVFQSNYGIGGGPVVSVIARLNPNNGIIEKGSFIIAQLENGNTNTYRVRGIGVQDNVVRVQGESAFRPPFEGQSFMMHPNANEFGPCGFFLSQIDLEIDLSEITASEVLTLEEVLSLPHRVWNGACEVQ